MFQPYKAIIRYYNYKKTYFNKTFLMNLTCRVLCIVMYSILTTLADANRTSMTNTYCVYTVLR
jgi:hypothetical protein